MGTEIPFGIWAKSDVFIVESHWLVRVGVQLPHGCSPQMTLQTLQLSVSGTAFPSTLALQGLQTMVPITHGIMES